MVRYKTIERKLKSHSLRLFDFPKLIYPSLHAFSEKKCNRPHVDVDVLAVAVVVAAAAAADQMQQLPIRPIFSFRYGRFYRQSRKKIATKKMKLPNVRDSNLPLVCDAHGRVESTWKQQQLNLFSLAGLTFGNAEKSLNR